MAFTDTSEKGAVMFKDGTCIYFTIHHIHLVSGFSCGEITLGDTKAIVIELDDGWYHHYRGLLVKYIRGVIPYTHSPKTVSDPSSIPYEHFVPLNGGRRLRRNRLNKEAELERVILLYHELAKSMLSNVILKENMDISDLTEYAETEAELWRRYSHANNVSQD
jgi:hypothetical protein